MQQPFQCLACVGNEHLIAASGPKILAHSLNNGEVSEWSSQTGPEVANGNHQAEDDGERPAKKQKIAKPPPKAPNVIKLTVSPDQQHVVAVTDDKFLRVFQVEDGRLLETSQRCMPKRPCAIQVLPDNATIVVGDKFGDVYSLPLIEAVSGNEEPTNGTKEAAASEKVFKPQATNLTVHSKRNLKALEAQQKQKDFTPKKEALKFKHELLLGHVSMLTDVKYLVDRSHEKPRGYIVTADRDEHIRLSRGPPQAHIIEGFCLGHTQYVNKICQVGDSNLLVSGGGDDFLGVWTWTEFRLMRKLDLISYVRKVDNDLPSDYHLAVSGIWSLSLDSSRVHESHVVIVACEKIKALFFISGSVLEQDPSQSADPPAKDEISIIKLDNNPLDVVALGSKIIVSLDGRKDGDTRLQIYSISKSGEADSGLLEVTLDQESAQQQRLVAFQQHEGPKENLADKELDDLLYGVANLRKRGPLEAKDGEEEQEAPEDE